VKRWLAVLPLAVFAALAAMLWHAMPAGPQRAARVVGRPLPAFRLAALDARQPPLQPAALQGRLWLLNLWASWCEPCRHEHPVLAQLAAQHALPIVGIAQHDTPEAIAAWLAQAGNPYTAIALDPDGQAALALGARGVPATYLIDAQGIVRWAHAGPLDAELVHTQVEARLRQIKEAQLPARQ
jgi:cytochrome c biogenesis protein CcmG/thiol:disulfide interchange protein DsbE